MNPSTAADCACGWSFVDGAKPAVPSADAERALATRASRKRLAFWIWMGGIASILTGAALVGESSVGGAVVGTAGVILCVVGRFIRIAAEQPIR